MQLVILSAAKNLKLGTGQNPVLRLRSGLKAFFAQHDSLKVSQVEHNRITFAAKTDKKCNNTQLKI